MNAPRESSPGQRAVRRWRKFCRQYFPGIDRLTSGREGRRRGKERRFSGLGRSWIESWRGESG